MTTVTEPEARNDGDADEAPEYECSRPGPPHGCGECDACLTAYDDAKEAGR